MNFVCRFFLFCCDHSEYWNWCSSWYVQIWSLTFLLFTSWLIHRIKHLKPHFRKNIVVFVGIPSIISKFEEFIETLTLKVARWELSQDWININWCSWFFRFCSIYNDLDEFQMTISFPLSGGYFPIFQRMNWVVVVSWQSPDPLSSSVCTGCSQVLILLHWVQFLMHGLRETGFIE